MIFGPLFFTILLQFIEVCRYLFMHSYLKLLGQHFNQFEVWNLTGPWFFSFSGILLEICCCVWDHCPFECSQFQPNFSCQTDGLKFDSRRLKYREKFMVNSMTVQALWLQIKPKSSAFHHCGGQLVWSVCADMLCLVFTSCVAVQYDQTSPLLSCLS